MPGLTRTHSSEKTYARHTKSLPKQDQVCPFCAFKSELDQIVEQTETYWVVRNIFPYDLWDSYGVDEHLMLVPKRHVTSLKELNRDEQLDFAELIGKYDAEGYSTYARAPANAMKSISHQHTHMMKLDNHPKRFLLFLRKPHRLFFR